MDDTGWMRRLLATWVVVAIGASGAPGRAADPKAPASRPPLVDAFQSGQDGYHTYRIPALVTTPKGDLLAICEGRKTSRADHGDVDIVARRSTDGGRTWEPMTRIYEEGGDQKITIGNPCPVVDRIKGVIWLPLTRDNKDVLITSSADDGRNWSAPRVITSQVKRNNWTWYATGPGNGIQLTRGPHKGRLVIPCDHRLAGVADRRASSRSHVIYSDDHGKTWRAGGGTQPKMNECAVVELADGSLLLNMRSFRGRQRRAIAFSRDGGQTWSACREDPALIEPVCQAAMIRWTRPSAGKAGKTGPLLFCNPASTRRREQLTIRISRDDGKTWPQSRLLYAGSSAYCSLAVLPNGDVGVLFERDEYRKLTFARLPAGWLTQQKAPR